MFNSLCFSCSHVSPQYNHSGTLRLEVGDYYQWRYYEVQWWSGYDFWYFVGTVVRTWLSDDEE